jgi:hypothetical protein
VRWGLVWLFVAACGRWGFQPRTQADAPGDVSADAASDGAVDAAVPANFVFVTSTAQPAMSLGGLAGADALCTTLAGNAGHPGTYVAWLSATGMDARDRLGTACGWVRYDGQPGVDTVADLVAGKLYYPIELDETGAAHTANNDYTVTGTGPTGSIFGVAPCGDWTTNGNAPVYGIPSAGVDLWTSWASTDCVGSTRIYCFQIDHDKQVAPPAPTGARLAFVSSASFGPNVSADGVCATDATSAGLNGTFLALLANDGTSAASRFTITTPWYRRDGVRVTTDLVTLDAALDLTAAGTPADAIVFTGAADPQTPGNSTSTCAAWTSNASTTSGIYAESAMATSWFSESSQTCDVPGLHAVYCFQQ